MKLSDESGDDAEDRAALFLKMDVRLRAPFSLTLTRSGRRGGGDR